MVTTSWASAEDAELIEVEFIKLGGASRSLKLLVDSGFTGKSSFVLAEDANDLVHAEYQPASETYDHSVTRVLVGCAGRR